jgi:hypothetical protein
VPPRVPSAEEKEAAAALIKEEHRYLAQPTPSTPPTATLQLQTFMAVFLVIIK